MTFYHFIMDKVIKGNSGALIHSMRLFTHAVIYPIFSLICFVFVKCQSEGFFVLFFIVSKTILQTWIKLILLLWAEENNFRTYSLKFITCFLRSEKYSFPSLEVLVPSPKNKYLLFRLFSLCWNTILWHAFVVFYFPWFAIIILLLPCLIFRKVEEWLFVPFFRHLVFSKVKACKL